MCNRLSVFHVLLTTLINTSSPASAGQCSDSVSMIRFSVFDHDVLSFNDFAGEAYFSLNAIPGIGHTGNSSVGNFHGLKQVHLPLMFQEDRGRHSYILEK